MPIDVIFLIAILVMSVVAHEVSHGYAADFLGDKTARLEGRLTLNPLNHIDFFGSIILPALLVLAKSPFLFGYAKPVPYNPYNLKNQRWGEAIVAGAGSLANLFIALLFAFLVRFFGEALPEEAVLISIIIVFINFLLGIFNLIPIPPLDGSKVLKSILPFKLSYAMSQFEAWMMQFGVLSFMGIILIFYFFLAPIFGALIFILTSVTTGLSPEALSLALKSFF